MRNTLLLLTCLISTSLTILADAGERLTVMDIGSGLGDESFVVRGMAAPYYENEVEIITPDLEKFSFISRSKLVNFVQRIVNKNEIVKARLVNKSTGEKYEPTGCYEKGGAFYAHYRLRLRNGENEIEAFPSGKLITANFIPMKSLLELDFNIPNTYLFHRESNIPPECIGCHLGELTAEIKDTSLRSSQSAECSSCHADIFKDKWQHLPVGKLQCRACHETDSSKGVLTIPTGKIEKLCYDCHTNFETLINNGTYIHGPVGSGDCTICHDPHGSGEQYLLWAEINELCIACHVSFKGEKKGHPVPNHPLEGNNDPRRKGFPFSCTSCHNPHGSKYKYLLIGDDRGGRICTMCHQRKSD